MLIVVDASVAVKWVVLEENAEIARQLITSEHDLHAPRLLVSEVGNAVWRKARLNEISHAEANTLLTLLRDIPIRWAFDEDITADAVRLALMLDRPIYDCVYLALAQHLGAVMLTADFRFANALSNTVHSDAVLTLNDYSQTQ